MQQRIREFNWKRATEEDWSMYHDLFAPIMMEMYPYYKKLTVEDTKNMTSNFPDVWEEHQWVVTDEKETEFLGRGGFAFRKNEDNLGYIFIDVARKHRKKGIAKTLLKLIIEHAPKFDRNIFTASTLSTVPDGESFVKHLKMKLGQTCKLSKVDFDRIDIELMKKWRSQLDESEFEIGFWQFPYPEDEIEAYAKMENDFWASAPMDDLEEEGTWTITMDELRQRMKICKEKNQERPVIYVKHRKTGEYAGYTDVIVDKAHPQKIDQFATGVLGKYRRKGIGRAIKGEMIMKLMELYPQAKFITTANSQTNKSMLNINIEMGYEPFSSWSQWQIKLDELKKYINGEEL